MPAEPPAPPPASSPAPSGGLSLPGPLSDPKVIVAAVAFAVGFGIGLQVMERMMRGRVQRVAVRAPCAECERRQVMAARQPVATQAPPVSEDDPGPQAAPRTFSASVSNGAGPAQAAPVDPEQPVAPGMVGPDRPQAAP